MVVEGFTILLYMFAFATGCMTLVLSVVFHLRESYQWTKYFIIFHASLLLVMVLQVLTIFVNIFLSETVAFVTGIVIQSLLAANISFLLAFIPFFTSWIIAQPWRNPWSYIFLFLASGYMALSILDMIFRNVWAFQSSMILLFVGALLFSIVRVIQNLKTITHPDVRLVSKAIIILSFVTMPLLVISIIYPHLRYITYPVYFMAFSIIILVYLFIYFHKMPHPPVKELTYLQVERFHITEREFDVILLIKEGLTNKEIAQELNISVNTVNNHVANIFAKTQVRSRIDLLNLVNEV